MTEVTKCHIQTVILLLLHVPVNFNITTCNEYPVISGQFTTLSFTKNLILTLVAQYMYLVTHPKLRW